MAHATATSADYYDRVLRDHSEHVGRIRTGIGFSVADDGGGLVTWAGGQESSVWDCLVHSEGVEGERRGEGGGP